MQCLAFLFRKIDKAPNRQQTATRSPNAEITISAKSTIQLPYPTPLIC